MLSKLKKIFESRVDYFDCAHCKKKSKGSWCNNIECYSKIPRGWYIDEDGNINKPSFRRERRHGREYRRWVERA